MIVFEGRYVAGDVNLTQGAKALSSDPLANTLPPGVRDTATAGLVIGKTGRVTDARSLDGPPALSRAALAAVRTMEFRPFLILGKPSEAKTAWEFNVQ